MGFVRHDVFRAGLGFCLLLGGSAVQAAEPVPAKPLGNPGEWVTTSDYPPEAKRNGNTGITGFELGIDAQGHVESCRVVASSGYDELDVAACNLITQRARFSAARDAQGNAVQGTFHSRVRWVLPNVNVVTEGPLVHDFTFIVETDGRNTDCKVLEWQDLGNAPPVRDICVDIMARPGHPFHNSSGRPVRKRVTVRASMTTTTTTTISDP